MAEITQLVTGLSFLEGPRWRDGALYVSDMHGDAVLSVTEDGDVSTVVELEQPSGLGWLPDGSLLISSMKRRSVMRYDGSELTMHSDLSALAAFDDFAHFIGANTQLAGQFGVGGVGVGFDRRFICHDRAVHFAAA